MMEWTWTKANEKELAQFATDSALQLFNLDVSSFDLIREEQFESLIEAIYNTLVEQKVKYDLEKFSTAETHQRIRTPVEILSQPRQGTCLDLAILFCGLCLGCNLLPKLIILEGHAIVAVSLVHNRKDWNSTKEQQKKFLGKRVKDSQGSERIEPEVFKDLDGLKDLIENGIYLAVECTGFAYSKTLSPDSTELAGATRNTEGFLSFEQSKEVGRKQLDRLPFRYAIDIAVAHEFWGIKPKTIEAPSGWDKLAATRLVKVSQKVGLLDNAVLEGAVVSGEAASGEFHITQEIETMQGGASATGYKGNA